MTLRREGVRSAERPDVLTVGRSAGAPHEDRPRRRLVTDGGQAEVEEADDSESGRDAEASDEESSEGGSGQEESSEGDANDETNGGDDESGSGGDEEDAEGEDEYHVEDAEDVYQDEGTSGVLHLDLDGLFLDVLGLEVNLNPVTLDVSARPGENNLLGNLLSTVSGLFDGPRAVLNRVKSALGKPGQWLRSLLGGVRERLGTLVKKPGVWLRGLVGGGPDGEEAEADEEDTEGGGEDAEAGGEDTEADEDATGGLLSRVVGRVRDSLSSVASAVRERVIGIVPGLPIEELVATIVSAILEQLIEQLEPEADEQSTDEGERAEAQS